jgi:maleylpyruvate isomerase
MRDSTTAGAWLEEGTRLIRTHLDALSDDALDDPSALPGWRRRHLLAHLSSNAEALNRLLTWARTGVETPMYASPTARTSEIESGAHRVDLRNWFCDSADDLARSMNSLPAQSWSAEVVTVQGRTVPASETRWMRARETCIHAVDFAVGVTFEDLPEAFLEALLDDVAGWRSAREGPSVVLVTPRTQHEIAGDGPPAHVELPLSDAADWLVGRHDNAGLPTLSPWL